MYFISLIHLIHNSLFSTTYVKLHPLSQGRAKDMFEGRNCLYKFLDRNMIISNRKIKFVQLCLYNPTFDYEAWLLNLINNYNPMYSTNHN